MASNMFLPGALSQGPSYGGYTAPPAQPCQPLATVPDDPKPGTLYVRDTFMPAGGGLFGPVTVPHGQLVITASQDQKQFSGTVRPSFMNPPSSVANVPSSNPHLGTLGSQELTREQALATISASTELKAASFLDDQSAYLDTLTQSGAKNSAANFSLGSSKASLSMELFEHVQTAVHAPAGRAAGLALGTGEHTAANYARAFEVDLEALRSQDDKTRQGEEARLQQAIIEHVSTTVDNSRSLDQASRRWDGAVQRFEDGNNSVVIAGGNEGDVAEVMQQWNGGTALRVPQDFEKNLLENERVTSVGATEPGPDGAPRPAAYSSASGGVDIYADGRVQNSSAERGYSEGTSFGAPRVGVTMAELHARYPRLSSAQVESLMKSQVSSQVPHNGSNVPVLDLNVDLSKLSERTY